MPRFAATVEIAPGADLTADPAGWPWVDVSAYLRQTSPVEIRRGRADETSTADAATLRLTLDNRDGRFTRLNPSGPWYGALGRGTPIRVFVDAGDGPSTRFTGHLSELPPRWDVRGNNRWATIVADGVIRRLAQADAIASPLRAAIIASAPVAYWPLEDAPGSTTAASAIPGVAPARAVAVAAQGFARQIVRYGDTDGPAGSYPAAVFPEGFLGLAGRPPLLAVGAAWTVVAWVKFETSETTALSMRPLRINSTPPTSGGIGRWQFQVTENQVSVVAYDATGATLGFQQPFVSAPRLPFDGEWHMIGLSASTSGANVAYTLLWDDMTSSGTITGQQLPPVERVECIDHTFTAAQVSLRAASHIGVWSGAPTVADLLDAASAHEHELAVDRMTRVCTQAGVDFTAVEGADPSEPCGPQPLGTVLDILRDTEHTDGGILAERLDGGLSYVARSALVAAAHGAPVLEITVADSELQPDMDVSDTDTHTVTDATASREGGSTARLVDEARIATEGRYTRSDTVNVAVDGRLPDYAGWMLWQGRGDHYRYPVIPIHLAGTPALIPQWTAADIGSRVTIPDPPAPLPPEPIDVLIDGYSETITPWSWEVAITGSPAETWRVGTLDDPTFGRLDTAGSRLYTDVDATATSLVVETTQGPPWLTTASHPDEFPLDIEAAGERITVTGVVPWVRDAFGLTVSGGWGTADSGQAWVTGGGTAADFAVAGGWASHSLGANDSLRTTTVDVDLTDIDVYWTCRTPVTATGAQIVCELLTHYVDASNHYRWEVGFQPSGNVDIRIRRFVAGSGTVIVSAPAVATYAPNVPVSVRCQSRAGRMRMKSWRQSMVEPHGWSFDITDTTHVMGDLGFFSLLAGGNTNTKPVALEYADFRVVNIQEFAATRSVNGIAKTHPAGTAIRLWQPIVMGL